MNKLAIFKALSNKTRLEILQWLKEPGKYFKAQEQDDFVRQGVCVGQIQARAGLTQSTVSEYLTILQKAGLLTQNRIGQWTYYKRNEKAIKELSKLFRNEI